MLTLGNDFHFFVYSSAYRVSYHIFALDCVSMATIYYIRSLLPLTCSFIEHLGDVRAFANIKSTAIPKLCT